MGMNVMTNNMLNESCAAKTKVEVTEHAMPQAPRALEVDADCRSYSRSRGNCRNRGKLGFWATSNPAAHTRPQAFVMRA